MKYKDSPDQVKGMTANNRVYTLIKGCKPVLKDNMVVSRFLVEAVMYRALVKAAASSIELDCPENQREQYSSVVAQLCGADAEFRALVAMAKDRFKDAKAEAEGVKS